SLSLPVLILRILPIFSVRNWSESLESAQELGTFSVSARMRTPGPRDRAREEREPRPAKSDDIRHAAV
ncbi:MAG: hypothetical protein AAFU75_05470, partial [Planctomycetota bacterium]